MPNNRIVFLDASSVPTEEINLSKLNSIGPIEYYDNTPPELVKERIADAEIIITNKVAIGKQEIAWAQNLKMIAVAATGYNVIDIEEASNQSIIVSNVPSYSTDAVTQHTFLMLFCLASNFTSYHKNITNGSWERSKMFCMRSNTITEVSGKTLGIIGYGEIGRAVANVAKSFKMNILIAERKGASKIRKGYTNFETVLQDADFITVHCPLNESTKNLITQKEFSMMKMSAFVINTARGGIIHEADLHKSIKEGSIAGAATDVLTEEPPKNGNILLDEPMSNLIVTPHIAWAGTSSCQKLIDEIAENILAFKRGNPRNEIK